MLHANNLLKGNDIHLLFITLSYRKKATSNKIKMGYVVYKMQADSADQCALQGVGVSVRTWKLP